MDEKRTIRIDDTNYKLHIYIERRSSTRVSITSRGINIRIPRHIAPSKREKEIQEMLAWATNQIRNDPKIVEKKEVYYYHGSYIKTHSKIYKLDIEIRNSQKNFTKLLPDRTIMFKLTNKKTEKERQEYMSKQLRKLLAREHHAELVRHVTRINDESFQKEVRKISYRYTKSRWGICKITDKEIELSTKLLLAPLPVLEYVIIHELAHLIVPDHSKRFWNVVKSVDPHYKQKVKWLRKNGHTLQI
jgi:predicted metal-dependent hydrolase